MKSWLKRFGGSMDWPNNVSGRGKITDPFGDWDKDGLPNMNDCQPRNRRKQDKGVAPTMQNAGQQFINQEKNLTSGMPTSMPAVARNVTTEIKTTPTIGGSFIQQERNLTSGPSITQLPAGDYIYSPQPIMDPINPTFPYSNPTKSIYQPLQAMKPRTPGSYIGDTGTWLFKSGSNPIFTTSKDIDSYIDRGYSAVVGTENVQPNDPTYMPVPKTYQIRPSKATPYV